MNKIKEIRESDFKRKTGIKKETFNLMLKILKENEEALLHNSYQF